MKTLAELQKMSFIPHHDCACCGSMVGWFPKGLRPYLDPSCEMCKSYAPAAECTMSIEGKVIARFWLCIGCQKEMKETYKNVLNKPLTAQ